MQMIIPPTRLIQHRRILRELEGIQAKFSLKKCVLRTPAVLETKSSAIPVCLSESCLSYDVARALCYYTSIRWCMIETSSGLPRKSSAIFAYIRKMLGSVRVTFGQVLENLRKVVGNLREIVKTAVISVYNKKNITR